MPYNRVGKVPRLKRSSALVCSALNDAKKSPMSLVVGSDMTDAEKSSG